MILKYNDRVVTHNDRWFAPRVYNVILNQTTGGTISANPVSGINGTTVTLSNSPSTNYTFNGYTISGSTLYDNNKFDINGSNVTCSASWTYVDPYNPLNLPSFTIRLLYPNGVTPTLNKYKIGGFKQVSSSPNVWDLTYSDRNASWQSLSSYITNTFIKVLGANTTGVTNLSGAFHDCKNLTHVALFDTSSVTNMSIMFSTCTSLVSVPLFDTSKVTSMMNMFKDCRVITTIPLFNTSRVTSMNSMLSNCYKLTYIPLFNTSKVTDMNNMAQACYKVESGALALYQQASSQSRPPTHYRTFIECGRDTTTGYAELQHIPESWGGLA